MIQKIFLFSLLALLFACKTYSEDDKKNFDSKIQNFIKKSKLKYEKSESGLYYFIEKEGEGETIKVTDEVSFKYVGKLLNGQVFDGQNKNKAAKFRVNQLIQGWQEAMLYVKKGGKMKLIVPPQLGYGDYDLDDIPKNSVLIFDMEIVEVN